MNENNQYVMQEPVINAPKKKKVNVIFWSGLVIILSFIISFILRGYSTSLASEGEAAIPMATFIESIATMIPFILIPIGIVIVVVISTIKNKK